MHILTLSKKEIAQKLGLTTQNGERVNYNSLQYHFERAKLFARLDMTKEEYIKRRVRFNSVESEIIADSLFKKVA